MFLKYIYSYDPRLCHSLDSWVSHYGNETSRPFFMSSGFLSDLEIRLHTKKSSKWEFISKINYLYIMSLDFNIIINKTGAFNKNK